MSEYYYSLFVKISFLERGQLKNLFREEAVPTCGTKIRK